MVKGNVLKIEKVNNITHVTIELPDPDKGLWYISADDPDKDKKHAHDQEIYDKRIMEQKLSLGNVELVQ